MRQPKTFTKELYEKLNAHPAIKTAYNGRVVFTLEFRQKIYDEIAPEFTATRVREAMLNNGFNIKLHSSIYASLANKFKNSRPKTSGNQELYKYSVPHKHIDNDYDLYLASTKYFTKANNGLSFTDALIDELVKLNHDHPVEEGLKLLNIDPDKLSKPRVLKLKKLVSEITGIPFKKRMTKTYYQPAEVEYLKNNPYVKLINNHQYIIHDAFYQEAASLLIKMPVIELLKMFKLYVNGMSERYIHLIELKLKRIYYGYLHLEVEPVKKDLEIERLRCQKLEEIVNENSSFLKKNFNKLPPKEKRQICLEINEIKHDKKTTNTKLQTIELFGISKSAFYSIIKNENYGLSVFKKELEDIKDVEIIRKVIEYKNYPKGSRLVYMMMPTICEKRMALNKIKRLMKKFNLNSSIRKTKQSRVQQKENYKNYCKDNLVNRTFRLHKPNDILLTDVSQFNYARNKGYLSATKDPVTGKVTLESSNHNDINLIKQTISRIEDYRPKIVHSDQGAVYMSNEYQKPLENMGSKVSMSRRGNCWDNSSMETFFGHLKDEIPLKGIKKFDDVLKAFKDYEYYYNYERPQWNRNRMTPMEYEAYLLNLPLEEYQKLMDKEKEKYLEKQKKSLELAKKRAKSLGFEDF